MYINISMNKTVASSVYIQKLSFASTNIEIKCCNTRTRVQEKNRSNCFLYIDQRLCYGGGICCPLIYHSLNVMNYTDHHDQHYYI